MYNFISQKEDDTILFASQFASYLRNGDVIVLTGELGSR